MKKLLSLLSAAAVCLALAACAASPAMSSSQSSTDSVDSSLSESSSEEPNGPLIIYFSCTNNTKRVAESIATLLGAAAFEIVPQIPYESADLNYRDEASRVCAEHNDPSIRPLISSLPDDLDGYSTIFIGYPIWWGEAPNIIYTLLDELDLSSKTIFPFCTSQSSGVGDSAKNLALYEPDSLWRDGKRFSQDFTDDEVDAWLISIGQK